MYHHLDSTKKQFIGKCIRSIVRKSNSSFLIEFTDYTKLRLSVSGDCCSRSIFYDLVLPSSCIGVEITDIREGVDGESQPEVIEKLKEFWDEEEYECLRIWDVVFETNGGPILFRHVNESNGYYDGDTTYEYFER